MEKMDIINEVVWEMSDVLTKEQQDRLKITFLVKMHDFDITEMRLLPAMDVHDNEWILKRYVIDSLAADRKESTVKAYVGAVRELFGRGTLLGLRIVPQEVYELGYINNGMMTMPAMALILVGCVIWVHRAYFYKEK